ncbi:glycosyltransferase family 4 protein [Streptomyces violascens]|uniref:glycosyltransferase family 4 protein n=1 Tax=Streptomyces violascens TaxID=67381 RepID=UPI0036BBFA27
MRVIVACPLDLPRLGQLLGDESDGLPPGLGGTGLAALVAAQAQAGHQVTLVTLCPSTRGPRRLRVGPVEVLVGPYRARHRARDAFRQERRAVRELVDSVDADLVHAHWTYEFGLGALASRHPVLVTVHDWAPAVLRYKPDAYRAVRLFMQARCLVRAPWLTVVSPVMAERLRRVGLSSVIVPNGLPTEYFAEPRAGVPRPVRRLLCVTSGFTTLKNTAALLEAFSQARSEMRELELRIVGPGHGPGEDAEVWARARGLAVGVVFAGARGVEGVRRELDRADLFVAPSLEESFGLVVAEAMARGVPVVGGRDSGAVSWLLDRGQAGELVDVRQPEAIARGVVDLAGDPGRCERLARAAWTRAVREFSLGPIVARYEEEYRRVVSG